MEEDEDDDESFFFDPDSRSNRESDGDIFSESLLDLSPSAEASCEEEAAKRDMGLSPSP